MASIEELFKNGANAERTEFSNLNNTRPRPPSFANEMNKRSGNESKISQSKVEQKRSRSNSSSSRSRSSSRSSHGSRRSRQRKKTRKRSHRSLSISSFDSKSHQSYKRSKRRRFHESQTDHFDDIASTDNVVGHAFQKSHEEMEAEKMSMFAELKRIAPDMSLWTNPKISMASSHEIISMELMIQKQNIDEDQKVFIARLLLGGACKGIEWGSCKIYDKVNGKFLQLQGWAASIMADTAQYDPILRRCYRKLFPQGMGKADPFMELAIALCISAVTYGLINRGMNQAANVGATSTSVPSNANAFMDRNTPTPAQTRAQAQQNKSKPQGGFMENILGALGGGGANNPLSSIMGMMQNGGLNSFMQNVTQSMNQQKSQEPPNDPFGINQNQDMDPLHQMKQDAHNDPYLKPVRSKNNKNNKRPPSPPFDERLGRFDKKSAPKRSTSVPSPVFGEPLKVNMDGPDESDFNGEDNQSIYDTQSMQTMDCESSGDVSQID